MIDGTGVLVREPYVENLAAVFTDLAQRPGELSRLSAASSARAQDFAPDKVLDRLLAIYAKAARS